MVNILGGRVMSKVAEANGCRRIFWGLVGI